MSSRALGNYIMNQSRPSSGFGGGGMEPGWIARLIRGDKYYEDKEEEKIRRRLEMLNNLQRAEEQKMYEIAEARKQKDDIDTAEAFMITVKALSSEELKALFPNAEELNAVLGGIEKDPTKKAAAGRYIKQVFGNITEQSGLNLNTVLKFRTDMELNKIDLQAAQDPRLKEARIAGRINEEETGFKALRVSPEEDVYTGLGKYSGLRKNPFLQRVATGGLTYDLKKKDWVQGYEDKPSFRIEEGGYTPRFPSKPSTPEAETELPSGTIPNYEPGPWPSGANIESTPTSSNRLEKLIETPTSTPAPTSRRRGPRGFRMTLEGGKIVQIPTGGDEEDEKTTVEELERQIILNYLRSNRVFEGFR